VSKFTDSLSLLFLHAACAVVAARPHCPQHV